MRIFEIKKAFLLVTVIFLLFFSGVSSMAQDVPPDLNVNEDNLSGTTAVGMDKTENGSLDPNLYVGLQEAFQSHMKLKIPPVQPDELKTIFFTLWQHKLLTEAKQWVHSRPLDAGEIEASQQEGNRPRGIRELSLGGILFATGEHWIVWLNGQRVTPDAVPKEVMDIHVRKDYVELKWFDSYSNLIYPIRLRPHQRFNLDSRIFLPGAPS
ncbi:MAG: hypothetical protein CO093_05455 [Alphaproteobacteria bacterium CG_4_9_14_3_um_filter_47_13]|nr:MAG: hypothetical protein CO093_05455 [Alphaproteobacteria bacterium CG_4_9_14_3_um_filter_47_13]